MRTPNIETLATIVIKILGYFSHVSKRDGSRCEKYLHFDIELARDEDFYSIHVTNCGQSDDNFHEIIPYCFKEISDDALSECCRDTVTLYVKGEEHENEQVYHTCCIDKQSNMSLVIMASQLKHFAHLKKYMSLRLECTLSSGDLEIFKESIIKRLENLDKLEPDVKYIFRSADEIYWRNHVEIDKAIGNCRLVGSAIMSTLRYTVDRRFRQRCLHLLNVNDSSEIRDVVTNKVAMLIRERSNKRNYGDYNSKTGIKRTRRD